LTQTNIPWKFHSIINMGSTKEHSNPIKIS
jgi:hypothetical protein